MEEEHQPCILMKQQMEAAVMLACVWFGVAIGFTCHVKNICFGFLKGQGCVESKNKTSAKRKSTMSSLDPSIIQVDSFKCRADVPLQSRTVQDKTYIDLCAPVKGPKNEA